jgi:hypothetical protein
LAQEFAHLIRDPNINVPLSLIQLVANPCDTQLSRIKKKKKSRATVMKVDKND